VVKSDQRHADKTLMAWSNGSESDATSDPPADAPSTSTPNAHLEAGRSGQGRWRPRVRSVVTLVVLVPLLTTGVLIASSAASAWQSSDRAQQVSRDADQLRTVALARAEMNRLEVPLLAVSYTESVGISETQLDGLLHAQVPFRVQLARVTSQIAAYPTFQSTPALRADVAELRNLVPQVAADTVSYSVVQPFATKMAADVDDVWYRDYDRMQADIGAWQPPGSFEVHAAALMQTYQAFLAGGHEIEGAIYVLEGVGPADAKQELIQAAGDFQAATNQFTGHLSPKAQLAWDQLQSSPADRQFAATIQQGLNVALNNLRPPFLGNLTFAGDSMAPGLHYLAALNLLVTQASADLRDTAAAQAAAAKGRLIGELVFLGALAVVCLGGVVVASRVLTRPLKKLSDAAYRIRSGDFDTERLEERGPREIATTTGAFNEMSSTLKAVQGKAVALAEENLSDPDLLTPLPGRTGQALQASVDLLATRIRERELQRQLLKEAATHDALTGLLNRAAVFQFLTEDVSRRRDAGETVAVLFIDLDGLKPLNDRYGHEVGDAAILTTAMALMFATDPCDVVGRLGGDEFLVVLCHHHSCQSDEVLGRIRDSIFQRTISVDGLTLALEASVGIALAECDPDTDPMVLVRQADAAMYEAKKAARAIRDRSLLS
jgi:diguanylate cyclase (GGDEF)-like protein